jgi:hypothetical protein
VDGSAETGSVWRLDLDAYVEPDLPMRIISDDQAIGVAA